MQNPELSSALKEYKNSVSFCRDQRKILYNLEDAAWDRLKKFLNKPGPYAYRGEIYDIDSDFLSSNKA